MSPALLDSNLILVKKIKKLNVGDIVTTSNGLIKRVFSINEDTVHLCGDNANISSEHIVTANSIKYKLIFKLR